MSQTPGGDRADGAAAHGARTPRRLVLLLDTENSEVKEVLVEYHGPEVRGARIHQDLRKHAQEYQGRCVAAEWLGPLGWSRYLWCRR